MSYCCGASMLLTKGTLKYMHTQIHNVPILLCPVCFRVEVHYLAKNEYEILAEYAHNDQAAEVDFQEYVDDRNDSRMLDNCVNHEDEDPLEVVRSQIDMALDLMMVAKQLSDHEWEAQLKTRLTALSKRRLKLRQKLINKLK